MRIVQVVHGLPPQDMTGTELLTLELARALQARGHQVTVIARTAAPEAAEFSVQYEQDIAPDTGQDIALDIGHAPDTSDRGVHIIRIVNNHTQTQSFQSQYDNAFFHHTFRRVLRDCQADIVHFQHVAHLSAGLIPLVSDLGYPTILSLPDFFFACHLVYLVDSTDRPCPGPQQGQRCVPCLRGVASAKEVRDRFSYLTRVLKVPHRIVVPSAFFADRIVADFPFLDDRLTVIPPGLPTPDALAAPGVSPGPTRRPPDGPLRILYLGVLLPHKGAHVLLAALKRLPPGRVQVSVYGAEVAFRRDYADRLRQTAAGLDKRSVPVRFCGAYQRAELSAILARHDVCVMPSICEEPFSLVTREALQAGLPVLAARHGAVPEVIRDGRNGLLFKPNDAEDLGPLFAASGRRAGAAGSAPASSDRSSDRSCARSCARPGHRPGVCVARRPRLRPRHGADLYLAGESAGLAKRACAPAAGGRQRTVRRSGAKCASWAGYAPAGAERVCADL